MPSFTFSTDVLQQYLRAIYNGFDTSRAVEPTMWREVLRVLNEATVSGLLQSSAPTHRDSFLAALCHSNEVFAAFKVHSMSERMAARLLNPDGTLKPFRQWADDVKSISSHYVGAWLRTEYDTALIRAHNAADWQQFIRDADVMPNLRWMPTTSPKPESSHRAFWERKLTLPVSDPFWDEHHPGDRWNCKCSLEQTDDPPTPELKAEFAGEAPQPGLTNNPGKDGHTFSQDHPYFPKSCSSCPFNKGMKNRLMKVFRNEEKHCYNCSKINRAIQQPGVATAKSLVDNVAKDMIARKTACSFYSFSDREVAKIKQQGVELVSRDIFLSDQRILHALRDFKKNNGKSVSPDELKFFVENIASCSMYFDTEKANIIFATNQNGKVQKFVVEPNYKIKANGTKFTANAFITAGVTQQYNLDEDKYIKIR